MTESVKGRTVAEVEALFGDFHRMVTAAPGTPPDAGLGKLAVLAGVGEFPMRVKCATLAWHTLSAALHDPKAVATTE
jgi:nitrogen fixation NifU-like protein